MRIIPPKYSAATMSPMEKKLVSNGGILWILISLVVSILPVLMLPVGILFKIALIAVILFIPAIGDIIQAIVIIWAIFCLFTKVFSILSVLFIISLIIYLIFVASPFFLNTVYVTIMEHKYNK